MNKNLRYGLLLLSVVQLFLAFAFFIQLPFVVNLWPFEGTTPLTFIFISSIFAAAGASTFWAVSTNNDAAIAGIGLDYVFIMIPAAIFGFQLNDSRYTLFGIAAIIGALFGAALFWWTQRIPFAPAPETPAPVRWSFVIFILALLVVATSLILKVPNVIPWSITPELSVLIGWMFLGAAAYFAYGLYRPSWMNAAGQLIGFLAYDIVLIVPFLNRLPTVAPQHQLGQIIYLIVVIYSGLLAIYYLFINRTTRIATLRQTPQPV